MKPPPFFISYPDIEAFKSGLPESLLQEYWSEIQKLTKKGLPPAVSYRVVAALFGYTPRFVSAMAKKPERYYREFTIPKGTKKRTIFAPKVALKVIQKWLAYYLSTALTFDSHVYGFVSGKSAPLAAKVHCNANWVYSIDIRDFFPSTKKYLVIKSLEKIGYTPESAEVISSLNIHNSGLAQGSPASPILSNIAFQDTDKKLNRLSRKYNVRLSRYADDIVFSGKGDPPEGLSHEAKDLIISAGWPIAKNKEYLSQVPHRLKVHGLLVHNDKPRLTKGYRNKIRAYKHLLKNNLIVEEDLDRVKGHINYANSIDQLN